jgi:hypothetical protein
MVAAHSQPLNGNLKAYSAWWLWARLAGWPGPQPTLHIELEPPATPTLSYVRPSGSATNSYLVEYSQDVLTWNNVPPEMIISQDETVTNGGVLVRTRLTGLSIPGAFYRLRVVQN